MQMIFVILYVLAGIMLAIPYCLLAGWNEESFPMVMLVAPAFLFIWLVIALFAGVITPDNNSRFKFSWRSAFGKSTTEGLPEYLTIFWIWTLYSLLPIIVHWSATLLGKAGYEEIGLVIDAHRYMSPLYVLVTVLAIGSIVIAVGTVVSNVRQKLRGTIAPID